MRNTDPPMASISELFRRIRGEEPYDLVAAYERGDSRVFESEQPLDMSVSRWPSAGRFCAVKGDGAGSLDRAVYKRRADGCYQTNAELGPYFPDREPIDRMSSVGPVQSTESAQSGAISPNRQCSKGLTIKAVAHW